MKQSALQLCQQNLVGAKAKDEAARAKLRADFPFAFQMVSELAEPDARQNRADLPLFKPRVVWMRDGSKLWERKDIGSSGNG